MSDLKMASRAHAVKHFAPGEVYVRTLQDAFEAGAAWQREQDSKIADSAEKRHLAMEDPTSAAVCGQVAAMIREHANQDSKSRYEHPAMCPPDCTTHKHQEIQLPGVCLTCGTELPTETSGCKCG